MKLSHEQKMLEAWRLINDLNITDSEEKFNSEPNIHYLVKDIYQVRDAFYSDLETEQQEKEEDLPAFFERHGIEWK